MLAKNSLGYFVAMFTTTMALSKKLTETTMQQWEVQWAVADSELKA